MSLQALLREPAMALVMGRIASASAVAAFGVMALLFFARSPRRRWLLSYSILALGISGYLLLPILEAPASPLFAGVLLRTASSLSFLLPATGYLLLLTFSGLELSPGRIVLLVLSALGIVTGAASRVAPVWLGKAAGVLLLVLSLEFLFALWRQGRRRKPEAPLLFTGTGILVIAVLLEAALRNQVLLFSWPEFPILGPSFICFQLLFLVAMAEESERLFTKATTDPLTGLFNRAAFLERARTELERTGRTGTSLAVAIIDVDRFKSFNDRFGHRQGDRVLVAVAETIQETIRGLDIAARWGGEEFVILYINVEEKGALIAIERVRAAISAIGLSRVPEKITVSAGITLHFGQFDKARIEELVHRADVGLYESKRNGRDRTTLVAMDPEVPRSAAEVRYR